MGNKSKRKAVRVNVSRLSGQQRTELGRFQKDLQTVGPELSKIGETAKQIFDAFRQSPQWSVLPGVPEGGVKPDEKIWTMGAPDVKYVDHIDGIDD